MGYEHPSGRSASRNPSRLSAGAIDLLIEAHLAEFDRVAKPVRDACATLERIALSLPPQAVYRLLDVATSLREGRS